MIPEVSSSLIATWGEWYHYILLYYLLLYIAVYYYGEPAWLLHAYKVLLAS